jgi:hypothetical protein
MAARRLIRTKVVKDGDSIEEIVVWLLDSPVPPCEHRYKYRLYFGSTERSYIRYDNERGKGDHRHVGSTEAGYRFTSLAQLLADFRHDVETWEAS